MRLYSGSSKQFIEDTVQNQIADRLKIAYFEYYRMHPTPAEINSWRNSLGAMCNLLQYSNLTDQGIALEYQLPLTSKRLDCMICGKDFNGNKNAVIIELKQWESCKEAEGDKVLTWVGGGNREVLHPSVQVGQYNMYLKDYNSAFYDESDPMQLYSCAYLHNYDYYPDDVLFAEKYQEYVKQYPVFTQDDADNLKNYLKTRLDAGGGLEVLEKIENSEYRPSKKLMEHVSKTIYENSEYILLDEQLIVFEKIYNSARGGFRNGKKRTIIVKGGPGTGKSVIAMNIMGKFLKEGINAQYATGSKAFTQTLWKKLGLRAKNQFRYFNSYLTAEKNSVDVLISDEAHRLRQYSHNQYTKKADRTDRPQIEELLEASIVSVFFIDDDQVVRPGELGTTEYIRQNAERLGHEVFEYQLEAQFRCSGSDAFVNWINNTLQIKRTANVLWNGKENFDFQIFDSPEELDKAIRMKNLEGEGNKARMSAGFCWKWSQPNQDGSLVNDIVVPYGESVYERPWNAKDDAKGLAPGIPKAPLWANDPNGINQVGCVYTAQGFEYDYAGVIFGNDLVYNPYMQRWEGHPENSADTTVKRGAKAEQFVELVKNTYRVLLSRGMKGCYVYFVDKETEKFFRSRMEI